jgi:uncharacterized membrane protein (GlpM family)
MGAIPKAVATELAFILGDHRLIEAVERGLGVGLWTLMAYMLVYLRVYGLWFFVIHVNDAVWVLLAVS